MLPYFFKKDHGQLTISIHWVRTQSGGVFWLLQMKAGPKSATLCQSWSVRFRADVCCPMHRLLPLSAADFRIREIEVFQKNRGSWANVTVGPLNICSYKVKTSFSRHISAHHWPEKPMLIVTRFCWLWLCLWVELELALKLPTKEFKHTFIVQTYACMCRMRADTCRNLLLFGAGLNFSFLKLN